MSATTITVVVLCMTILGRRAGVAVLKRSSSPTWLIFDLHSSSSSPSNVFPVLITIDQFESPSPVSPPSSPGLRFTNWTIEKRGKDDRGDEMRDAGCRMQKRKMPKCKMRESGSGSGWIGLLGRCRCTLTCQQPYLRGRIVEARKFRS